MTPTNTRIAKRWGPYAGLVGAVTLLLVVAPSVQPRETSQFASGAQFGSGGSGSGLGGGATGSGGSGAPGASGSGGASGSAAAGAGSSGSGSGVSESGSAVSGALGPRGGSGAAGAPGAGTAGGAVVPASGGFRQTGTDCSRRAELGSVFPCEPLGTTGDNGGGTYKGVTATQVTLAQYIGGSNAAVNAVLQQANAYEPPSQVQSDYDVYQKWFPGHFQTYGRRVNVIVDQGRAQLGDAPAARADAVTLDSQYHSFFVYGGSDINFQDELARRGIPSMIATPGTFPEATLTQYSPQGNGPGLYQVLPTPEQTNESLASFICTKLKPRSPAQYAGIGTQGKPRVYGIVYPTEQPNAGVGNDLKGRLAQRCGINVAVTFGRTPDINSGAEQASTAETKMAQNGVTTELCLCDPVTPLFLTHAATTQSYFPEWLVTGYQGQDDDLAGQNYDQQQWAHAFGVGPIQEALPKQQSAWYKVYKSVSPNTEPGIAAPLSFLFLQQAYQALEAAGPTLNPLTLQAGLFTEKVTARNEYDTTFYFGPNHHGGVADYTEVWWDPNGTSVSSPGSKGAYRYVDFGHRFLPDAWPSTPANAFDPKCLPNGSCGNPAYAHTDPMP